MNPTHLRSYLLLLVALLFGVAKGQAATVTFDSESLNQVYNGSPRPVTVNKTPGNLEVTVTYQGSGTTVYPSSTTAPTNAGNYIVTASYEDDGDPETTIDLLIVAKAPQTITFDPIADYDADARPIPLLATASSDLPVQFTVSGPAVIVDGNKVKPTGAGTVTVTASQPGDENFDPATPVDRTFTVNPGKKRILAIGDSFTQGGFGNAGYRDAFLRILKGEKINGSNPFGTDYTTFVDMIGTVTTTAGGNPANSSFPNTLGRDPENEGHYGWSADDILNGNLEEPAAGNLSDWLASYTYLPTIVLLHIGTVDALFDSRESGKKFFPQTTRNEIGGIIDTIKATAPNCQIFVAKIPPGGYYTGSHGSTIYDWANGTNTINALIDGLAAEKNAEAGSSFVYTVDNFTDFNPATMLMDDKLHPNPIGEAFIASNFFNAIRWSLNGQAAPPTPPIYSGPPRILALGDSITQGGNGQIGYRGPLMRLFAGENIEGVNPTNKVITAKFIGTMNTTYDNNPFIPDYPALVHAQPQHEGHGAWEAKHILNGWPEADPASWGTGTGKLSEWLLGYTPDVVLLHIGSNDAWRNANNPDFATETRNSIGGILNTLKGANPNVTIFLAKLIPGAPWFNDRVNAINAQLSGLASELNAAHFRPFIYIVDQNIGFSTSTMLKDDIHPNQAGADQMAIKWYNAIADFLSTGSLIPRIISPATAGGQLGQPFSYAITATSAPSSYSATGLPSGLAVNPTTGAIGGTPSTTGTFPVSITAANSSGSDTTTLTITISKAAAPVTLSALSHVYDGTGKAAVATTTPAGLNVTFTYDGGATLPVTVGSYAVVATINDNLYLGSATGTLVITKAAATVTLGSLSQPYSGAPITPTAATVPAGLNVTYTFGGFGGPSGAPTSPGIYPVTGTIQDANYEGSAGGTLTITKADQNITFPVLQDITRDINFVILSATASSGLPVSYSIVNGPASLTASVLTPTGTGTVTIRATQTGDVNYNAAAAVERTLRVVEANATITISNLQFSYNGSPKTPSVATTPGNLPVTITYSGQTAAPVNAGSYSVLATVNDVNYAGSASATLVIEKAPATVTVAGTFQKFDGTAKSVTATTVPAGLPVTTTYNGSATPPSAKGTYEVVSTITHQNYAGTTTATLSIGAGAQLVNLSSRALVGAGGDIMIPGFVVGGTGTKTLLIRGIGPALAQFGLGLDVLLQNPTLRLLSGNTVVASNTGWSTAPNAAEILTRSVEVGAFALAQSSGDCAMLLSAAPGSYTVQLSGLNDTTGVGLVEIYDLDETGSSARLVNISTRSQVGTGGDILIPGYVIHGDVPRTLLIRAVGPTLGEDFGVAGVLADPTLAVFKENEQIASNDNWGTNANLAELQSTTEAVGAFALVSGSKDAAMLITLNPGAYTVQVSGVGSTIGLSLVEVYEIEN